MTMYIKYTSHVITAFSFALLSGVEADSPNAEVSHSSKQYLQNSSVTQGSLECQARCLAAPRSFLLKGNISVRVTEALNTHQSYVYYTQTNGSDPQCSLTQVLTL